MIFKNLLAKHRATALFGVYMMFCLISLGLSSSRLILRPKEIGLSIFALGQEGIMGVGAFFSGTVTSIRTLGELKSDYAAALDRLKHFERIEKQYQILEEENTRLKEVLQFSQGMEFKNIPAKIIGKDPQNYHSTITINKGSLSGIEKNMPVVAMQNGRQGLVGKIAGTGFKLRRYSPSTIPRLSWEHGF
jgi:rod shape-determining protein MreC